MRCGSWNPEPARQSVAERYRHPLAIRTNSLVIRRTYQAPHSVRQPSTAHPADARMSRLEAVLFLAREPLGTRKLSQLASLADGTEARTLIRRLNERYDAEGTAFRVEQIAGGYQLLTRPAFAPWLRRLHSTPPETRLSGPALETLAVVAYRQPVLRADIESIRGVQSAEMLRQLMERDLVRIAGRSNELGRPYFYGTTKRFLQVFGLRSLDELPRSDAWRMSNGLDQKNLSVADVAAPDKPFQPSDPEEESEVRFHADAEHDVEEQLEHQAGLATLIAQNEVRAVEDEDDFDDDEDDDDLDDDDDELEEDDEDLEDDEWEEVEDDEEEDDEEEDWEDEDDEDEDWDDDEEDDDWDDDEEEEEEWDEE